MRTPGLFDLAWEKPEPLVPRRRRLEATERIAADGAIVTPAGRGAVREAAAAFMADGADAVAIMLHQQLRQRCARAPAAAFLREEVPIARCHRVLRGAARDQGIRADQHHGGERLPPAGDAPLPGQSRGAALRGIGVDAPLLVVASNGGVVGAAGAAERPVFAVGSGPAAGVAGAARLGSVLGASDLIAFDMGGTTAKAALVEDGRAAAHYRIRVPRGHLHAVTLHQGRGATC